MKASMSGSGWIPRCFSLLTSSSRSSNRDPTPWHRAAKSNVSRTVSSPMWSSFWLTYAAVRCGMNSDNRWPLYVIKPSFFKSLSSFPANARRSVDFPAPNAHPCNNQSPPSWVSDYVSLWHLSKHLLMITQDHTNEIRSQFSWVLVKSTISRKHVRVTMLTHMTIPNYCW